MCGAVRAMLYCIVLFCMNNEIIITRLIGLLQDKNERIKKSSRRRPNSNHDEDVNIHLDIPTPYIQIPEATANNINSRKKVYDMLFSRF